MTRGGDLGRRRARRAALAATGTLLVLATTAVGGDGTFAAAPSSPLSVGNQPSYVLAADLNGDGRADLVTVNKGAPSLSVRLGDGHGGFTNGSTVTTGSVPESATVGDFNGDGRQDLVAANSIGDSVSVALGDGAGGFAAPTEIPVGDQPDGVVTADLDGNGNQDLVTANFNAATVSVLLGNGLGSFSPAAATAVGGSTYGLTVTDLNGDGAQDIITANGGSNSISVLRGNGTGGFTGPATTTAAGSMMTSVSAGDLDGDGYPDIVATSFSGNALHVFRSLGNGALAPAVTVGVPSGPVRTAMGDVDDDGRLDVLVTSYYNNTVRILRGDGTGSFTTPWADVPVGSVPYSVAVADFDGDGNADLATANSSANTASVLLGGGADPDPENLIVNPGAEGSGAAGIRTGTSTLPGWTRTTTQPVAVRYATPGAPLMTDAARWNGGVNLFMGGATTGGTATQNVDVSGDASSIDAGLASATLSGLIGGRTTQADTAQVSLTYLDGAGTPVGSALAIGPVTPADRHNQDVLLRREAAGAIPAGTRAIRVTMTFVRLSGTNADGMADDLSLHVSAPAPPPSLPPVTPPPTTPDEPVATPPQEPPAVVRAPEPAVTLKAMVSEAGVAGVGLACPADAAARCRGTLVIDAAAPTVRAHAQAQEVVARIARGGRRISFGRRAYSISPGRRATVAVTLNTAGRARLGRSGRVTARALTIVRQPDGTRVTTASRIILVGR